MHFHTHLCPPNLKMLEPSLQRFHCNWSHLRILGVKSQSGTMSSLSSIVSKGTKTRLYKQLLPSMLHKTLLRFLRGRFSIPRCATPHAIAHIARRGNIIISRHCGAIAAIILTRHACFSLLGLQTQRGGTEGSQFFPHSYKTSRCSYNSIEVCTLWFF